MTFHPVLMSEKGKYIINCAMHISFMQFCNGSANYQFVVISVQKELGMSQTTYSIQMDSDLKKDFDAICKDLGMSPATAINEFVKVVVRERRIPFEIPFDNKGGEALRILRATAKKNGIQDMSLDEINEEIRKAREGIGD